MKERILVSESSFSGTKLTEILDSLGGNIGTKLEGDSSNVFSSNFHIKENCFVCEYVAQC